MRRVIFSLNACTGAAHKTYIIFRRKLFAYHYNGKVKNVYNLRSSTFESYQSYTDCQKPRDFLTTQYAHVYFTTNCTHRGTSPIVAGIKSVIDLFLVDYNPSIIHRMPILRTIDRVMGVLFRNFEWETNNRRPTCHHRSYKKSGDWHILLTNHSRCRRKNCFYANFSFNLSISFAPGSNFCRPAVF